MKISRIVREVLLRRKIRKGLCHSPQVAALLETNASLDIARATDMIGCSLGKLKSGLSALSAENERFPKAEGALRWHAQVLTTFQSDLNGGKLNPAKKLQWRELIVSSATAVRQATN